MKKNVYFIFFILAASLNSIYPSMGEHRFYIAPDIFYRDYDEILTKPAKSHEYGTLGGLQLGYDYIKENSVYFGSDARVSIGSTVYDGSVANLITQEITPYVNETINFFFNGEIRVGNTYRYKSTFFMPFGGIGYHYWLRGATSNNPYGYSEEYSWPYLTIGFKSITKVRNDFWVGFNLKLMQMFNGTMYSSDLSDTTFKIGSKLQYEVELPLAYDLKEKFSFIDQICLVPYYRNQNIGKSQIVPVYIGSPINNYLYFLEPSSVTHVLGIRLELARNF
jgi:hypothetical protein